MSASQQPAVLACAAVKAAVQLEKGGFEPSETVEAASAAAAADAVKEGLNRYRRPVAARLNASE